MYDEIKQHEDGQWYVESSTGTDAPIGPFGVRDDAERELDWQWASYGRAREDFAVELYREDKWEREHDQYYVDHISE